MTVHDGMIYRLLATPSFVGVEAVDARYGAVRWKTTHDWSAFGIAADDDRAYFLSGPDEKGNSFVNAVLAATGETLWQSPSSELLYGLTLAGETLYVFDEADTVLSVNTADGVIGWGAFIDPMGPTKRDMRDTALAFPRPVVGESSVVGLSSTGVLTAIDRESGEEVWHRDGFDFLNTHVQLACDVVVVFTQPGVADAGTPTTVNLDATPEDDVASDFEVLATTTEWQAMGLSLADGSTLWEHEIVGPVARTDAIEDTVAYLVLNEGTENTGTAVTPHQTVLYGLDATSGEVVRSVSSEKSFFTTLGSWIPTEGWQELFIVAVDDGTLRVIDPHQQGRSKGAEIGIHQPAISEPVGDQNGLYLTLLDGTLIPLSSTTVIDGQ